ncbi:MAG: BACON domain-containing protein, partial [Bryobacteraceae bacterium]
LITVTLVVSDAAMLTVSPAALSFAFQTGGALPGQQVVEVKSTGAPISYTVQAQSTPSWLSVTPSNGVSPGNLIIGAAPLGLTAGTYSGNIVLTPVQSGVTPILIPVTLYVSATPLLVVSPIAMTFTVQVGSTTSDTRNVAITSTGAALNVSVTTTVNSGGTSWLLASTATTTPSNISVQVNPTGLAAATYTGTVIVSSSGPGTAPANSPQNIVVTLIVQPAALLTVTPNSLQYTQVVGGNAPPVQTLAVTSSGPQLIVSATATTNDGFGWLSVTSSATTPGNLTVTANGASLSPGTYFGFITVVAPGAANSPQAFQVTLTIVNPQTITVTPTSMSFTATAGGGSPSSQVLQISTSGGTAPYTLTVTTQQSSGWLTALPLNGNTPATVNISVNHAGLSAGTYTGTIAVTVAGGTNSPLSVPVTLVVSPQFTLSATPSSLAFTFTQAGPTPNAQTISATSTGGPVQLNVTALSNGNWLAVSPSSGATPVTLNVSVNPTGLAIGNYTGTLTLTPSATGVSVITVNVTLAVLAPVFTPTINRITNSGSDLDTSMAGGLIVTAKGVDLGPASGVVAGPSGGRYPTTLGGTRVLAEGVASIVLFARNNQVNFIIPYSLSNRATIRIVIEYNGVRSNQVELRVDASAPGVFTVDSSGRGQGAILNQNARVNGLEGGAPRDTIVSIYMTGGGQLSPSGEDGVVIGLPLPVLLGGPVVVTIGGVEVPVFYAGPAPGLVSGAIQVNAHILPTVPTGNVEVRVRIGNATSQPGVTMLVTP